MLEPAPGEEMEDFVDRMFLPFSDNREWKCSKCVYNPSRTGVRSALPIESVCEVHGYHPCQCISRKWVITEDEQSVEQVVWYGMEERLAWCGDCYEELMADLWEDIIVHAQDNDPTEAAVFDLLLAWKP
jgi:hypothetical protein